MPSTIAERLPVAAGMKALNRHGRWAQRDSQLVLTGEPWWAGQGQKQAPGGSPKPVSTRAVLVANALWQHQSHYIEIRSLLWRLPISKGRTRLKDSKEIL